MDQLWQHGGGGGPGLLGANPIAFVVPQARLISKQLLADAALPSRVLRVSHLVSLSDESNYENIDEICPRFATKRVCRKCQLDLPGRDFEEGLVAHRAVVLLLLEVHFADVAVQPVGFSEVMRVVGKFLWTPGPDIGDMHYSPYKCL